MFLRRNFWCKTFVKFCIITAIADALNCKICVTRDKKMVLDCLDDMTMKARVSMCWQDSGLHVLPMNKLNYKVSNCISCWLLTLSMLWVNLADDELILLYPARW